MRPIPGLIQSLERWMEDCGTRVLRAPLPDLVHGRVARDLITLRLGLTPLQEFAALVHEVTHWLVHRDPRSDLDCTIFEYEAETVEALILERVGLAGARNLSTDGLLPASVARVRSARARICDALGIVGEAPPASQPQTTVDLQATPGEEIVFEYEPYGMGYFLGLPEAL